MADLESQDAVRLERDFLLQLLELAHHDEPRPLLEESLELIVRLSGADKGYIELYDGDREAGGGRRFFAAHGVSGAMIDAIRATLSTTIIRETLQSGKTVETASALNDDRYEATRSVRTHAIQAVVCTPIRLAVGAPVGVVYLQGHRAGLAFPKHAVRFAELFARHLAPIAHRVLATEADRTPDPTATWRAKLAGSERLIGRSHALAETLHAASLVAPLDLHVLITGESGAGKSLLARVIADNGPRRHGPFIELNCANLPDTLLESELFGALPGSHSTATKRVPGKVEAAEGGTLFLDEIGELTNPAQAKLLQLLQSRTYFPLGATRPQTANVRIISATNVDLAERVLEGRFREDLFYRLQVMPIALPPLDARRSDIPLLARHFCAHATESLHLPELGLSAATERALEVADWPGSVRQLENFISAAVVRAYGEESRTLEPRHVFTELAHQANPQTNFQEAVRQFQRRLLADALKRHEWNVTEAAKALGIARSHAYNLIRALGLEREG